MIKDTKNYSGEPPYEELRKLIDFSQCPPNTYGWKMLKKTTGEVKIKWVGDWGQYLGNAPDFGVRLRRIKGFNRQVQVENPLIKGKK